MEKMLNNDLIRINVVRSILEVFKTFLIDNVPLYIDDYYKILKENSFFEMKNRYGRDNYYKIENRLTKIFDKTIRKYFFDKFKEKICFDISINDYKNIPLIQKRFILAKDIYNIIINLSEKETLDIISSIKSFKNDIPITKETNIYKFKNKDFKPNFNCFYFFIKENNKCKVFKFVIDFRKTDDNNIPIAKFYDKITELTYSSLNCYLSISFVYHEIDHIIKIYDNIYNTHKKEIQDLIKTLFQTVVSEINNLEIYLMFKSIDFSNDNHIKIIMESLRNKDIDKTNKTVEGFLKEVYKKIKGGFELWKK